MRRTADEIARLLGGRWSAPADVSALRERPRGVTIDSRAVRTGDVFVALPGSRVDGRDFIDAAIGAGAAFAIAPPRGGWAPASAARTLLVEDPVAALATLAADHRDGFGRAEVVGVTGSVGKTTTCRLLDATLGESLRGSASERSFNNHLGVPLTLLNAHEDDEYVICEIGASMPGDIARLACVARPTIAVITGAGRAHLERLGSVEGVAKEKSSLGRAVGPGGVVFVADGFPIEDGELGAGGAEVVRVGATARAGVRIAGAEHVRMRTGETPVPLGDCDPDRIVLRVTLADGGVFEAPIAGRALALNVALTAAVGRRLGLRDEQIATGLRRMVPAPMRFERRVVGGVEIYNDAYNANPESLTAALETFAEIARPSARRVLVLGDMLELGDECEAQHADLLERALATPGVMRICLIGPAFAHAANRATDDRIVIYPEFDDSAVAAAASHIEPGDAVLLKGSRGMRLERVAEILTAREPAHAATLR